MSEDADRPDAGGPQPGLGTTPSPSGHGSLPEPPLGARAPLLSGTRKPLSNQQLESRQQAFLLSLVRGGFIVIVVVITFLALIQAGDDATTGFEERLGGRWWVPVGLAVLLATAFVLIDIFTPKKRISTIAGVVFGLLAGLVVTLAIGFVIDLVAETWDLTADENVLGAKIIGTFKLLIAVCLCYVGITTVLQTQDNFRLVVPYVEFAKQIRGPRPLVLDTSALIDARVLDLAATGVVQAPLVIPVFVIDELQRLADSADKVKRAKGRRGLDVIQRLQRSATLDVSLDDTHVPGKAVDQMLVDLAKQMPGMIVTTDTGLCRVAKIQSAAAINLNDLAVAMKPSMVPGEAMRIVIVRAGEQPGQGVGYLDDGTMVVVDGGQDAVGRTLEVEITSTIQTAGGRMLFAEPTHDEPIDEPARASNRPPRAPVAPPSRDANEAPTSPPEPRTDPQTDTQTKPQPRPQPEPAPTSEASPPASTQREPQRGGDGPHPPRAPRPNARPRSPRR